MVINYWVHAGRRDSVIHERPEVLGSILYNNSQQLTAATEFQNLYLPHI